MIVKLITLRRYVSSSSLWCWCQEMALQLGPGLGDTHGAAPPLPPASRCCRPSASQSSVAITEIVVEVIKPYDSFMNYLRDLHTEAPLQSHMHVCVMCNLRMLGYKIIHE